MGKDLELQCIGLNIPNVRQIVILNLYRPPQGSVSVFIEKLNESIDKLQMNRNAELYIMGDFNVNMLDKKSQQTKDLLLTMKMLGGLPLIQEYTRKSTNPSCIDQIFTNSSVIAESGVVDLNVSDHLAIYCSRKKMHIKQSKREFTGRSYRTYVKEDFQGKLIDLDWRSFYECTDPVECWDIMETNIRSEIDLMCPIKKFKVTASRDPWITNELLEEIRDKDLALNRARRTGRDEDWAFARRERNRVGRLVELARRNFFEEEERNNRGDPKRFWKNVSSIIPNKSNEKSMISLVDHSTNSKVDPNAVPDYINTFFANVGINLAKDFTDTWVPNYPPNTDTVLTDIATDFEQVHDLCKEINSSKSSAIDLLSARILKDAFLVLTLQLVYLFNISLSQGIFPSKWKVATVIPLFKGGSRSEVGNYRPISLLPLPGKLLEKIVHVRISQFLENSNVLCDEQCGFRKERSTTLSIVNLTDSLFTAINNHETSFAIFIDLKKAFDTVNHDILLRKLEHIGIRGRVLMWVSNYLHDRSQSTFANNSISGTLPVNCGVPQGSILGPLFFISYINDVKDYIDDVEIGLYADDTVIFTHDADWQLALASLQSKLDAFVKWCNMNALTINTKKTKFMTFGTRAKIKKVQNARLLVGDSLIQKVPNYKYLGFTLDPVLSFASHISTLLNVVAHKAFVLSEMRRYLTERAAIRIYKAMLLPYFDYADIVYDRARQFDLDKLQRAQNKCLKTCMLANVRTDTDHIHTYTKVAKLSNRRKAHLRNFMFLRKKAPYLLKPGDAATRARDAPLFRTMIPKCEAYKRSVLYNGAIEWNGLSVDLRNVDLLLPFKFHRKSWLTGTFN